MSDDEFRDQVRGVLPAARQLLTRRVRDLIRVSIAARGHQVPGAATLDAEPALMADLDAPRDVVRDALALLVAEGLIRRRRGVGTLARDDQYAMSALLPPSGESLEAHQGVGHLSPRLLHWEWMKAPAPVRARLDGVVAGDDCLCVDYVLLRDGQPCAVITNYVRGSEAARLTATDFRSDFYALLADGGTDIVAHDVVLQAATADAHVAALLHVLPGEAVLWLEQTLHDERGAAIDFAVATFRRETRVGLTGVPRLGLSTLLRPPSGTAEPVAPEPGRPEQSLPEQRA